MKLFNLDSPVMVFLTKVANLMILNLLTIICCIPIITVGPAVTALYYVTIKMARGDEPYIVKSYFKSFKENFKQATILWIVMLALIIVLILDWEVVVLMMSGTGAKIMKVVLGVVTIFFVMTALYIFPVLSRFENTIKQTVKNAFLISIMSLPKTVVIILIHLLPLGLLLLTIQALPFLFLLGMPAVAYLSSMMFVRVFKKFEPEEEDLGNGDELAPLSFIVEEQQAKQAALEAEQAAERAAREKAAQEASGSEEEKGEETAEEGAGADASEAPAEDGKEDAGQA
ncbi:MAG: YesL family protein [Eisenbergiella sp.]|nr:DUF624 domain-containing protein [Bacillota bacterium]